MSDKEIVEKLTRQLHFNRDMVEYMLIESAIAEQRKEFQESISVEKIKEVLTAKGVVCVLLCVKKQQPKISALEYVA